MRRLPPATGLELAQHCAFPWSGGLAARREPLRPLQRYGIAFHELAARLNALETDPGDVAAQIATAHRLPEADATRLRSTAVHLRDALHCDDAEDARPEMAMAWNHLTGQARAAGKPWETDESEIYGRADLVLIERHRGLVVRDWKPRGTVRARRPAELLQLRFLALAAAALFGERRVTVEIAYADEDGADVVPGELSDADLMRVEGEVLGIVERVQEAPEPRPGPWCERLWCPVRAVCPATRAALARVHEDLDRWPLVGEPLSPEHAAWQRHRLPVLRAALDEQERRIEDFASRSPIPVEGKPGFVWGPVEHQGNERLELSPIAEKLIAERLGVAGAEVAIEKSASKASLERGAKSVIADANGGKVPRGAVPRLVDPLIDDLRAAKALKRGAKFVRFEEFKRPEGEGEPLQIEPSAEVDEPADDCGGEDFPF